jgi:hypothetical protein
MLSHIKSHALPIGDVVVYIDVDAFGGGGEVAVNGIDGGPISYEGYELLVLGILDKIDICLLFVLQYNNNTLIVVNEFLEE